MTDENSAAAGKPRLLAELRTAIRARHDSIRTEEAYVYWTRFYVRFHNTRQPAELNEPHVALFLTHLAVERKAAASTQNQALNAVVFLYKHNVSFFNELPRPIHTARHNLWRCVAN